MPNWVKVKMLDGSTKEIDLDTCVKFEFTPSGVKRSEPKVFGEDTPAHPAARTDEPGTSPGESL